MLLGCYEHAIKVLYVVLQMCCKECYGACRRGVIRRVITVLHGCYKECDKGVIRWVTRNVAMWFKGML